MFFSSSPVIRRLVTVACIVAAPIVGGVALAATIDVSGALIGFVESVDVGESAVVGDSHTYVDVLPPSYPDVDAKVTVSDIDGLTVDKLDDHSSDAARNPELQLETDISAPGQSAEITVEFFESGTSTPAVLSGIAVNVKDIDDLQWAEFSGITSYLLAVDSALVVETASSNPAVAAGATRFHEPGGVSDDTNDPKYWADVRFGATSSVVFRVGAETAEEASFNVHFEGAIWSVPTEGGGSTGEPGDTDDGDLPSTGVGLWPVLALGGAVTVAGLLTRRRIFGIS
jgi:hypothetical protein